MTQRLSAITALFLQLFFPSLAVAEGKLTHKEAKLRSEQIENVRYLLKLDVSHKLEFKGDVTIFFDLKDSRAEPLRVDFFDGQVQSLTLNGKKIPYTYDKEAIWIKPADLKPGKSELKIAYSHAFDRDGDGLYRFVDPADKKVYIWTQFEAFAANQMFPSFDQPDLKARFASEILAPKDWTIVTATRESAVKIEKDLRRWIFPESLPLSTYVYSLHGGPWKIWEDKSFRVPLRLMARQSLAPHVKAEEWLTWTRFGFDFYEKAFALPYPYLKYDQLLVPDFGGGAMENVAAVTFNERNAPRGERSARTQENNFNVLLHELSHMWFGNMVTMKWWDDLWLNESFASYAANYAMAAHPDYGHSWVNFHGDKTWGYAADEFPTTHPIVGEIADTKVAESVFDGITYGKGASWLKLLVYRVGEDQFFAGLKDYFQKHKFANTTVHDLIAALETKEAAATSLAEFSNTWLNTAGLNRVSIKANCDQNSQLTSLDIRQGAPKSHDTLRPHTMAVALFSEASESDVWKPSQVIKIDYSGSETRIKLSEKLACPALVFPNATDDDYVKVQFSEETFKKLIQNIRRFEDPLLRSIVWDSVGWALEDGDLSLRNAIEFTATELSAEKDFAVLGNIEDFIKFRILQHLQEFPERSLRIKLADILARGLEKVLMDTKTAKDFRLSAFDNYINFLTLTEDKDALGRIYSGKTKFPGLTPDQPRRWTLLKQLAALGDSRALTWSNQEKDRSNEAEISKRSIRASLAIPSEKLRIVQDIVKDESRVTRAEARASFSALYPPAQFSSRKDFESAYVKELPNILKHKEEFVQAAYLLTLLPVSCDERDDELFKKVLAFDWPVSIRQDLLERQHNLKLCRKLRLRELSQAKV